MSTPISQRPTTFDGVHFVEGDGNGDFVVTKDWEYERKQAGRILQSRMKRASLPVELLQYDPAVDYVGSDRAGNIAKLRKYIAHFDERYRSVNLYFWSLENGTQKTTIAQWVARELLSRNFRAHFILMHQLVKLVERVEWEKRDDDYLERLKKCDFLVIDDAFDTSKMLLYRSKHQLPFIDSFLRERLEHLRGHATCFTSNTPIDQIHAEYGASIESLIERNIPDPFHFADRITAKDRFDPATLWED